MIAELELPLLFSVGVVVATVAMDWLLFSLVRCQMILGHIQS